MISFKNITLMSLLVLASVSLGGCSSSDNLIAPTAAIDTAPPAVPTGLAASSGRSTVKLSWHRNTLDTDLQGYMVYRLAFGQAWPLTDSPIADMKFMDRSPINGYSTYAVYSVDTSGNESAWTTIRYNYQPEYEERSQ